MTASLRIQSSKADSNTWESFTRSGLKLESVHQESPRSDVFRKRATKPLLNQRQRQKRLTWSVEKKNGLLLSEPRVTTLRRLQEKGYQATSEPETTSEASYLGCGEKELDCCSVVQESPRSDVFRKRATKPLLNQRQRQKRLTWAVEKKNSVVQSPLFR